MVKTRWFGGARCSAWMIRVDESEVMKMFNEYKGYAIEFDFYGEGEYSVQYCGDDVMFKTMDEAKKFIDEVTK